MPAFLDALNDHVLLADGAMGTQLQLAGLGPGDCGEFWNLQHPEKVLAIQQAYVHAGADVLITNSFGGCALALGRHNLADHVREINEAAVRIARAAFSSPRGFVLGDIGPFGGFMEPVGDTPVSAVRDAFHEQADALIAAGVDGIILETQVSLEELAIAIEEAHTAGAACIIASLAYTVAGDDLRTIMGITPEHAARFARQAGADIIALNCGRGVDMEWSARCVQQYRNACALPTMAQPNGGPPIMEEGKFTYRQTPDAMAAALPALLAAGVNVVGACCGSTPAHIAALRPLIDQHNRRNSSRR